MFEGYHNALRFHSAKIMTKTVDIPDTSLGVGDAEYSGTIGIKPNYNQPIRTAKVQDVKTTENTLSLGKGKQFFAEQFPKSFYLGEGI